MTKVTLNDVGSLIDATTAATTINNNFDTIKTAFDNTLSRDGTSPNTMGASLDMNAHTILNLPAATATGQPVTYEVFEAALVGHGNLPLGGTTGQVLAKTSNVDYATAWTSESTEISAGTNISVTGGSPAIISTVTNPTFVSPSITTPTGIVKGDVGLGNVDNTSDATKNAAAVTLTNKTITSPTISGHPVIEGVTSTGATGTGKFVFDTNPTISGNIASTTFNNVGISSAGSTATIGMGSGKNLQVGNSLTLNGTDGTTVTFPTTSATIARTDAAQTFTGAQTFSTTIVGSVNGNAATVTTNANLTGAVTSVGNGTSLGSFTSANLKTALSDETGSGAAVFATSPALVTPTGIVKGDVGLGNVDNTSDVTKWAATKTLTNTTYDTAGTGNSLSINGVAATANTGTGSVVRATSPTLVTPVLGVATATSINGVTLDNTAWTSYTPTITAQTGSIPTLSASGRYKQIGKTILLQVTVSVGAGGTAVGNIFATLPFTANSSGTWVGGSYEYSVTGNGGISAVLTSATTLTIKNISAATYWVNGYAVAASVAYEIP